MLILLHFKACHSLEELLVSAVFRVHIVFLLLLLCVLNEIDCLPYYVRRLWLNISMLDDSDEWFVQEIMIWYNLNVPSAKVLRDN